MKTFILSAFCLLVTGIAAKATTIDSTYKEYVGRYIFGDESPVPEVNIFIQDSVLMADAVEAGLPPVPIRKAGADSFYVNQYNALSFAFKRDASGYVGRLIVYTKSGDMYTGEKQKPNGAAIRNKLMWTKEKECGATL